MILFPNAKINLGLSITGKRADNYHNLETVFYPIPLQDALEVVDSGSSRKYTLHLSGDTITGDPQENLVVKAYLLLDARYHLPPVDIYLLKRIPSGAGLGGGSSDAACMLKLLNETFSLGVSTRELEKYASRLGADCPFFIRNKPVFARGIGDVFSPVSLSLKGYHLVVVKPDLFISTRDAFRYVRPTPAPHPLQEVITYPVKEWKNYMRNDFEESIFRQYPEIGEIKNRLYRKGALYASMSGSGSSVYGIFGQQPELSGFENCFLWNGEL